MQLDSQTKQLLRELGRAINEAVSDSDRIADIITRIKATGFDVFLMLDAVVALNHTEDPTGESDNLAEQRFLKSLKIRVNSEREKERKALPEGSIAPSSLTITPQDLKFLKSLKISIDDLS